MNGNPISGQLYVDLVNKALDSRAQVNTIADRDALPAGYRYKGMVVFVKSTNQYFKFEFSGAETQSQYANNLNWKTVDMHNHPNLTALTLLGMDGNCQPTWNNQPLPTTGGGGVGTQGPRGYQGLSGPQGPQGFDGKTGPAGPQGITGSFKGVYDTTVIYNNTDFVNYNGEAWVCLVDGTQNQTPANGPYWTLLVKGGTAGSQGADGPQGPQGNQGNQGHQGLSGTNGNQGQTGVQGNQGVQGLKGNQGDQGNQGVQGTQGNQGLLGNQGFLGQQGPQGNQGYQGNQGNSGTNGNQGNQGAAIMGPKGNQGDQGFQGLQGTQGTQGNQGLKGNQGDRGFMGADGPQGFQGVAGNQGITGGAGNQGHQGFQGYQGNQGHQGNQGNQGLPSTVEGPQGRQGNQGYQGAKGLDSTAVGTQGTQGSTGLQGPQGNQGFIGITGAQGLPSTVQGPQGFTGLTGGQGSQGNQGAAITGAQGNQGDTGPKGNQGNQGFVGAASTVQGPQGTAGNLWTVGTGVPVIVGTSGDMFLDSTAWNVYKYTTSWTLVGNIKGAVGTTGTAGNTWYRSNGVPNNAVGNVNGDYCLDVTNFDVYQKQSNTWVVQGSIKPTLTIGTVTSGTANATIVGSTLNLTLPQGSQGNQGAIGPQGNQGAAITGGQGNQGPQGNQGAVGSGGGSGGYKNYRLSCGQSAVNNSPVVSCYALIGTDLDPAVTTPITILKKLASAQATDIKIEALANVQVISCSILLDVNDLTIANSATDGFTIDFGSVGADPTNGNNFFGTGDNSTYAGTYCPMVQVYAYQGAWKSTGVGYTLASSGGTKNGSSRIVKITGLTVSTPVWVRISF